MIVFGSRLYGRTDEVPGVFFVATEFFQLYYVPLLPLHTYVVLEETGTSWRGVALRYFSRKSILLAWLRIACMVTAITSAVLLLITDQAWEKITAGGLLAGCLSAIYILSWSRLFRYANLARAMRVARQVGLESTLAPVLMAQFNEEEEERTPPA
jgi:hypothetical protein